ncbi:MAG TPA: SDR family NAD(P)-dependent oxidoreductase [Candidatus Dormibacteraeota bacterium]|nr:SDR family NAD(P)-dependent oxidoreductase [Candidatus Dormibacteraeota bacterium]
MSAPVAVVTGASSGIGAATVRALHDAGFDVVAGARREERLRAVCDEVGARCMRLDVTDQQSVDAFVAQLDSCAVLVNNAGGALGLDPVAQADDEQWRTMYETNVLGLMRMTRALLPLLERADPGHIVDIVSTAGIETYPGGGGYTAAKHAAHAVTRTLRMELLGKPVRVTEIDPGMVETEFSVVRLGSQEKADKVYEGVTPMTAEDIADAVAWVVTRPKRVNVDQMVMRPLDQASATMVHRRT